MFPESTPNSATFVVALDLKTFSFLAASKAV